MLGSRLVLVEILIHVPEGAAIHGVHRHTGVVAPLAGVFVVGGPCKQIEFRRRVEAAEAPLRGAQTRMAGTVRNAITHSCFREIILSDAWHETKQGRIGTDSSVLKEGGS